MRTCRYCGGKIIWDAYWETWDHYGRAHKVTAELCYPKQGFGVSKMAEPE